MKTYTTHGRCRHYTAADAYPLTRDGKRAWATRTAMRAARTVEEAAFAVASLTDHREHDRIFSLVVDASGDWGVRCELSRGYPGEWPHLEIFGSEREARAAYDAAVARYDADASWARV